MITIPITTKMIEMIAKLEWELTKKMGKSTDSMIVTEHKTLKANG